MKKRLLLILYCLLLCCTATFAWILNGDPEYVRNIVIDYTDDNKMCISSVNVKANAYFIMESGEVPAEQFELDASELIPDTMIPFRITLDYQAQDPEKSALPVKLTLVGITVSDPRLLNMMYISVTPKNEGLSSTNGRGSVYKCFSEAKLMGDGVTYSLDIYDSENRLFIPHNEENGPASELDCYLYFDRKADATYQGMSINITSFRLEQ